MKRTSFLIFIGLVAFVVRGYGQVQAKLSAIDISGVINDISVSPEGKIWLVDRKGCTYYANGIDSNWHYGPTLFERAEDAYGRIEDPLVLNYTTEVFFFNKDTALITACNLFLGGSSFLTINGGKTVSRFGLGTDDCYGTHCAHTKGCIWMGTESKGILFSDDYGQHWTPLKHPATNAHNGIDCISMMSPTRGILVVSDWEVSVLNSNLYITSDNWKSSEKIETPCLQNKYIQDPKHNNDLITKALLWKDFIVVNQNGYIYYTPSNTINWQPFPIKVCDFVLDNDTQTLWGITDSLGIVAFSSPAKYELVTHERLSGLPKSMKLVGQSLFALLKDNRICRVNKSGIVYTKFYTTDWCTPKLKTIKRGSTVSWGINSQKIYTAEPNSNHWYKENTMSFPIADIRLLNDSTAILWDGIKNNYSYSLKEHKAVPYPIRIPFESFIRFPIQSFAVSVSAQSCLADDIIVVNYEKLNDSIFSTQQVKHRRFDQITSIPFDNKTNINQLKSALVAINAHPSEVPSIKDFKITEADKQKYLASAPTYRRGKKVVAKDFYYAIPSMLDTLSDSVIREVFNQVDGGGSDAYEYRFTIVNSAKDTLIFSRDYSVSSLPWHLPWIVRYKGVKFACYNIDCSRFIASCIPDKLFWDKKLFDNSALLMEIADYLWDKR